MTSRPGVSNHEREPKILVEFGNKVWYRSGFIHDKSLVSEHSEDSRTCSRASRQVWMVMGPSCRAQAAVIVVTVVEATGALPP